MGTDPFEEFEFKPLTEGLGFHQKKTLGSHGIDFTESPVPAKPSAMNQAGAQAPINDGQNPFRAPLPRAGNKANAATAKGTANSSTSTSSAVDEILNALHQNRKLEIENDRQQRQELRNPKKTTTWKLASPKLAPIFLDGMLITAAFLLCLIAMLVITHVDLLANLSNPDSEGTVYASTLALFAGVTFVYMIIHRIFLGFTPGEWAYDLRLGRPEEQKQTSFIGKVIARQILLSVTGLILLPLAGALVGKDLVGALTGLSLNRKV